MVNQGRTPHHRQTDRPRHDRKGWRHTHHDPTAQRLVHAPAALFSSSGGSTARSSVSSTDLAHFPCAAGPVMSVASSRTAPPSLSTGVIAHGGEEAARWLSRLQGSQVCLCPDAHRQEKETVHPKIRTRGRRLQQLVPMLAPHACAPHFFPKNVTNASFHDMCFGV